MKQMRRQIEFFYVATIVEFRIQHRPMWRRQI